MDSSVVESAMRDLEENEYRDYVEQLKKEMSKKKADMVNVKTLLNNTFNNRRQWIDSTASSELPLAMILDEYPCFHISDCILKELSLLTTADTVSEFPGRAAYGL